MKKYILTLLLSGLLFSACDKDDQFKIQEWTIASELGIAHGPHTLQPVLLYKTGNDTSWRRHYEGIEGFTYEQGYEYQLRVKAEQLSDPPQDGSSIRYTLLEQISKIPAHSVIPAHPTFTMEVAPTRFPTMKGYIWVCVSRSGDQRMQPWPFPIEGFDYEPGYTYRLSIGTSVVPSPESPGGYFTVRYSLLELLGKEPGEN